MTKNVFFLRQFLLILRMYSDSKQKKIFIACILYRQCELNVCVHRQWIFQNPPVGNQKCSRALFVCYIHV